jgi:nucleotide-binding universal stress UspA family protein
MDTQSTTGAIERRRVTENAGFDRLLVVTDRSDAARSALALAGEWAGLFGAELSVLEVSEAGATLGARNRRLAEGIAEAARDCGADAIVLGVDRRRTTHRHLGRCLRDQLARTTAVPVLIAPAFASAAEVGRASSGRDVASAPLTPVRRLETSGRAARA